MLDPRFVVVFALVSAACGATGNGSTDAGVASDAMPECAVATDCESEEACTGGQCCPIEDACGSLCCTGEAICSFGACVEPGDACLDTTECREDEYCEYAAGEDVDGGVPPTCSSGAIPPNGRCLARPPECADGVVPSDPPECLIACEYRPPATFSPILKYSWGSLATANTADSIMMAPIVVQLDDDSCDGVINERDIPEIVFSTFESGNYNGNGTLHAISIIEGVVVDKWAVNAGATSPNHPGRSIAGGNIDGLPGNEVVVCTTDGRVRAYYGTGAELWLSTDSGSCSMPSIADVDQDGTVEIITESQIIDGATGANKVTYPAFANVVAVDVTNNGILNLVGADRVLDTMGVEIAASGLTGAQVAVGDLDGNGIPEIIVSDRAAHALHIWRVKMGEPGNAEIVRQDIDINGVLSPLLCPVGSAGSTRGGGPPTIADFNGDGFPDIALAGGVGYAVFDGSELMTPTTANEDTLLWIKQTQDCSSAATGSSVFDFNGDGAAEVVYADETTLRVYEGATGDELFSTCNTSGTLFEYPLIADVDNDGQADFLAVSNNYSSLACGGGEKTTGLRIFGDADGAWVRTRSVWNQHAYHVTNVEESGEIPTIELPNHLQPSLNNFRQNVQPAGEFSAPDLIASVRGLCAPNGFLARVQNVGEAAAPAGVPVAFYAGDPDAGGVELAGSPILTTRPLYPAEGEDLLLEATPPLGTEVFVVVDPAPNHPWHECREDNNKSLPTLGCAID